LTADPIQTDSSAPNPRFPRRLGSETRIAIVLLAFGAILMASNRRFAPVDDEVAIIDVAATPALATMKLYRGGGRQHAHPPLSDLILHEWLRLTVGNIHLLRLPLIVFYLLGAWFLAQGACQNLHFDAAIAVALWISLRAFNGLVFLHVPAGGFADPRVLEICRIPVARELDAGSASRVGAGVHELLRVGCAGLSGLRSFMET
jgi:hypothetical protein